MAMAATPAYTFISEIDACCDGDNGNGNGNACLHFFCGSSREEQL